ncbi:hypothetical protein SAMN05216327_102323 [Dyadobacter sp. SG02]|uniref:alpha/beta hydrolase family protein n=1 Tax=Dyadobacter sp. SG02 TaxID=1855291 RepID=UPI0008AF71C8|nr:alpha/beta fold hydrolase [Dyadobacter sp. SG02]SEI53868.1 hypothetical protein SAMN05216327_102323 [Dyadobacter sp. SG02]
MKKNITLALFLALIVACVVYIALPGKSNPSRPQEPKLPYPYRSEEITFLNEHSNIKLSGTLTLPAKEGSFPAVVLITGSGPQDRNEEIFGHKPFLIIADYLTRHGFAVLRYDDRGIGKSTGRFMTATSLDLASDAESAVAYLKSRKEINPAQVGLAGHSEGGLVAAIAASRSKDIGFVVSLAGPGAPGLEILALQTELIAQAGGVDQAGMALLKKSNREIAGILRATPDTAELKTKLTAYTDAHMGNYPAQMLPPGQTRETFFKNQIQMMCGPWYQFLYKVEPAVYFKNVTCPVLAINGSKDLQVDARQNLPAISKALKEGGNGKVTIKELADLNHLFQKSKTGHPNEYAGIEETFSPAALAIISDWLTAQTSQNSIITAH